MTRRRRSPVSVRRLRASRKSSAPVLELAKHGAGRPSRASIIDDFCAAFEGVKLAQEHMQRMFDRMMKA